MLRRLLLYLSAAGWARGIVTHWGVARRVALRFVAGETLDDAIRTSKALNEQGLWVSLDFLGESVAHADDTREVVAMYCNLMERIQREGIKAGVSLKLTHLGLDISEDLCVTNLREILTASQGLPVTIDMESTPYTDVTLRIYRTMHDEYNFQNVGTVIQAYLYRSEEDMRQLATEGAHVRLCKGAYLEPADLAFPQKSDVDANYAKLADAYLAAKSPAYLCIATHDENMIQSAKQSITRYNIPPTDYEFQMLYGIRSSRQTELVAEGHQMRVYVPFGTAWYPYFMRRLAERPANLWFFMRGLFSR